MINKELYNLVIEADKQAKNCGECNDCFCYLFKSRLQGSNFEDFLNWRVKNKGKGYTVCDSILFYLQDLGLIKVSSVAYDRFEGVRCSKQKYTIIKKNIQGNKI